MFFMKPAALVHKWGFPAVAFRSSQLNRGSLIQKAKVANYDMRPIFLCQAWSETDRAIRGY